MLADEIDNDNTYKFDDMSNSHEKQEPLSANNIHMQLPDGQ
mgnify:CR=1 FL=1